MDGSRGKILVNLLINMPMLLLSDVSVYPLVYLVSVIQYSHFEKWREETLQSQGGCLQLWNRFLGDCPK